ncbi:hypothetical protein PHYBLDRAFT_60146 [Phycomyces blakesleeanus NRRL 1555(-)]|uniref:Uncharacterized protein n=1 Tax=Phycomyces blakesleeanus (strain ATCC 8743b / DSM 1359 / FGSC 10004 / NBRC 33097 / NRRL 1555) TaxID=763407 RepID=A0A167LE10_PHYB8|nr:hypothetical protein PHYBLDRAFT_60146 [Phycomyces blakesleeanus NRRL 1555(-)]OAD70245.1 hypothetical protein PHYBLDRAFT_60146 [Phycomyces blakesleeanus NRRL 1555(-)]|eukprot:XP_018288285.1 hypothetical protein PHYBLDRAFT_60146 [Phycomyces blakesleeanus NRRL 1555(-)]
MVDIVYCVLCIIIIRSNYKDFSDDQNMKCSSIFPVINKKRIGFALPYLEFNINNVFVILWLYCAYPQVAWKYNSSSELQLLKHKKSKKQKQMCYDYRCLIIITKTCQARASQNIGMLTSGHITYHSGAQTSKFSAPPITQIYVAMTNLSYITKFQYSHARILIE